MKILIVNGYPNTPSGNQEFQKFHQLIQEVVRAQTDFVDTNLEFITRDRDDLDDYLYELDSPYVKKTSAKAFDYIDMVFIEGEASLLPWSSLASKMLILLRMCLRTKKILFASSFAMQALVYLAATNTEKNISIINGKGKGGNLEDILEFNGKLASIKHDEYFLDNTTGDLYSYNYETSEWIPKMSVGIHYTKGVQAADSMGKFVKNTPTYKAKVFENNPMSYLSKNTEDFCYPKKVSLQHWAMINLPSEFVVPCKNSWDVHKFNFVNPNKTFTVLAESKRCPQIIIFEPYCVATLFQITKKYAVTVTFLTNFVASKLKELKSLSKNKVISIEQVSEQYRSLANNFFNFSQDAHNIEAGRKVPSSRGISDLKSARSKESLAEDKTSSARPQTAKLIHSGYALAHHDGSNLIVENNTVRNHFTIKTGDDRPSTARLAGSTTRSNNYRITKKAFVSPIDTNFDSVKINFSTNQNFFPATAPNQAIALHNYLQKVHVYPQDIPYEANSFSVRKEESTNRPGSRSLRQDIRGEAPCSNKNKAEIARMLYPDLPVTAVKEEELWVPGQLSRARPQTSTARNKVRITMDTSFSGRFYSTYNKFKDVNPDDARAKPSIRTSGDYITEDQKKRHQEKENARKNLGPAHITFGSKCLKPNFVPNYVSLTYSEPPANHKFRDTKKDKWVAGPMKLC